MLRKILLGSLLSIFLSGQVLAQGVTLKQIGKETVLFSTRFVEWYNHNLYTIDNTGALYRTDLSTGVQTRLGKVTYNHTRYLFIVNGQLYCLEDDGSMNRIDIATGDWTVVSSVGSWKDIERVVVVGRNFYATQNGALYYHPTMNDRVRKQVGEAEFYDLGYLLRTDTSLHSMIGGTLYNINLTTGKWKKIGPNKGWRYFRAGAVIGNKLYTVETPSSLVETDLTTGAKKELDGTQFKNAQVLFADGGKLYAIFSLGLLYEVVLGTQ